MNMSKAKKIAVAVLWDYYPSYGDRGLCGVKRLEFIGPNCMFHADRYRTRHNLKDMQLTLIYR